MTGRILLVDDDDDFRVSLANYLAEYYDVNPVRSAHEARKAIARGVSLVLLDIRLVADESDNRDGISLLKEIKTEFPAVPVVMMTAFGDVETAVEAMRHGAADYIQKGKVDIRDYRRVIDGLLEKKRLVRRIEQLSEDLERLEPAELIGSSPAVAEVRKVVGMVAAEGETTVLITGETGTGKELIARTIHRQGSRRDGPFVPVALSALSASLVESELFGHERGAFTGADRRRIGYVEKADGGVLFLDEVGELDPAVQVKLLRLLENRRFCRVGSSDETEVDVQFVAATNRDLPDAVRAGRFRQDLYYRLKMAEIEVSALRRRTEDIPLLVDHFLALRRANGATRCRDVAREARNLMTAHSWPGNVRELRSCVEWAALSADFHQRVVIAVEDLPRDLREPTPPVARLAGSETVEAPATIDRELAIFELERIDAALRKTGGRKAEAARSLGYNDRFAMLRRVRSVADRYPDLIPQYQYLRRGYDNET